MTDLLYLIAVISGAVALAVWLDAALQRQQYTDPRDLVDRAHSWDGGES